MDWKALREAKGLTLQQLAELSDYSIATINGLELRGEGSERLKAKLKEILTGKSSVRQIALEFREGPEGHMVEDALAELEEIKEHIKLLEIKLRKMQK